MHHARVRRADPRHLVGCEVSRLAPDQDWAAKWPGTVGYYAIGSNMRDAKECRNEGAEIVIVSRSEAVAGHREFLDSRNEPQ